MPGGSGRVHTDDLAWHESIFGWDHLFEPGVLAPLRRGEAVAFRPPAWVKRGREGAIAVPAGTDPVVREGVGASRRSLAAVITASIWVETPEPVRLARDDVRVAAGEIGPEDYARWMREEDAFLRADRPWSRARWLVSGASHLAHDEGSEVVVLERQAYGEGGHSPRRTA